MFVLAIAFQSSLTFADIPGAFSRRKHLKGAPIGLALVLPSNSKTGLERVSKDKPSSLLGLVINDEGKKFYNIDHGCQSYNKTLLLQRRQGKISWSVCFFLNLICEYALVEHRTIPGYSGWLLALPSHVRIARTNCQEQTLLFGSKTGAYHQWPMLLNFLQP